ncbi:MAG: PIG-L family deacetylase [Flavobacterium sp.]|nr:PIG-L family deacetylase [Flavobacterium sp.]
MQNLFRVVFLIITYTTFAQQPTKPNAVEIYHNIQKLNFLGSVLYIAAHPDDENTRLISYMSNEIKARTAYLSLTRGDGGQNLIGTELGDLLGVIRTQELLEARKIDGGIQFFTRANDFGYSKNPDETLRLWDRDQVLSDIVYVIRKFRPDIIVNRFDHRSPGTTHGHHTSSAMLSKEAFDKSNLKTFLPEQFNLVTPWQPTRLFFNTSHWFYGGKDKFDKADKSKLYRLPIGVYFPMTGKSNQEIASLSRSRHRSQGFGSTGTRGEDLDYLELIKGAAPATPDDLFEGIDTSWTRVTGGTEIGQVLTVVERDFDFKNPSASIPELLRAYNLIQSLEDPHWKVVKTNEIKNIIAACAGLFLEAVAKEQDATPGTAIDIDIEAINRSNQPFVLESVSLLPGNREIVKKQMLGHNIAVNFSENLVLPNNLPYTQPYWLTEPAASGMYTVSDPKNIGLPDVIRNVKVRFNISILGHKLSFTNDVVYKYNDRVFGEVYRPFDIFPDVTLSISNKVVIFPTTVSQKVAVNVKALKDDLSGTIKLQLPSNWRTSPELIPFKIAKKDGVQIVTFEVTPPKNAGEIIAKATAQIGSRIFDQEQITIDYPHITKQQVLKSAESKFIKLDIKTGGEKIAYIMGAGDEVNKSLSQMGYEVQTLEPWQISKEKLAEFDVVITGVRAYNTIQELADKQQLLLDFVHQGHTMIVQYNTAGDFVTTDFSPFPLEISRDRVTEEDAKVTFLEPDHKVLNFPNKITSADFQNWVQEQGLYYPDKWDPAFTPIISSHDRGEQPKKGALLIAKYGKGTYIYTGLSFFRELPQGVSGAFRLMANMISSNK